MASSTPDVWWWSNESITAMQPRILCARCTTHPGSLHSPLVFGGDFQPPPGMLGPFFFLVLYKGLYRARKWNFPMVQTDVHAGHFLDHPASFREGMPPEGEVLQSHVLKILSRNDAMPSIVTNPACGI